MKEVLDVRHPYLWLSGDSVCSTTLLSGGRRHIVAHARAQNFTAALARNYNREDKMRELSTPA